MGGLPDMESKQPKYKLPILLTIVPPLIGFTIATAIFHYDSTKAAARIEAIVSAELYWAFAALSVLGRTVTWINMYPMAHKAAIMKQDSGNLRSNMYIYKAIGNDASDNAIIMEEHGPAGNYNRANRSLHHMIENNAIMVAGIFAAGHVFPFPAFVCVCVFCVGRALHQVGYATKGYGRHGPGFLLATLATLTIGGMTTLVALKGFAVM